MGPVPTYTNVEAPHLDPPIDECVIRAADEAMWDVLGEDMIRDLADQYDDELAA